MATILKAIGLNRSFSSGSSEVRAIRDIDLEIGAGEFVCIMGSSGSGKSTLLNALSGLDKASSGRIEFKGDPIEALGERSLALMRRKAFGFVFQNINLLPQLSIYENILIAGFLPSGQRRLVRRRARERTLSLMERFGISELADRLPSETSGGQAQRAAVARALVNEPDILFADEPTGALNFASGTGLLDSFKEINDAGQTILMVSHDLKAAARAARAVFMRDGAIIGEHRFPEGMANPIADSAAREKALFGWLSERGW